MRYIWISRHWESCVKQKIRTVGNTWIGGYRIWISQGLSWSINPTAGMRSIRFISSSDCPGKYLHTTYGSIQVEDGSLTIRTKNSVYEFELDASCVSEVDMILLLRMVNEYFRDDGM